MLFTPLPITLENPARLFLLLPPRVISTPRELFPCASLVLTPSFVVGIPLGAGHAHLDELARHVHPDEVPLVIELPESVPEVLCAFPGNRRAVLKRQRGRRADL